MHACPLLRRSPDMPHRTCFNLWNIGMDSDWINSSALSRTCSVFLLHLMCEPLIASTRCKWLKVEQEVVKHMCPWQVKVTHIGMTWGSWCWRWMRLPRLMIPLRSINIDDGNQMLDFWNYNDAEHKWQICMVVWCRFHFRVMTSTDDWNWDTLCLDVCIAWLLVIYWLRLHQLQPT